MTIIIFSSCLLSVINICIFVEYFKYSYYKIIPIFLNTLFFGTKLYIKTYVYTPQSRKLRMFVCTNSTPPRRKCLPILKHRMNKCTTLEIFTLLGIDIVIFSRPPKKHTICCKKRPLTKKNIPLFS